MARYEEEGGEANELRGVDGVGARGANDEVLQRCSSLALYLAPKFQLHFENQRVSPVSRSNSHLGG